MEILLSRKLAIPNGGPLSPTLIGLLIQIDGSLHTSLSSSKTVPDVLRFKERDNREHIVMIIGIMSEPI